VRKVLRRQQDDRLAGIAALGQQPLRRIDVAWAFEDVAALLGVKGRAGGEEAGQRLPHLRVVADMRLHVIFLAHGHQNGAACPHIVEGRVKMVEA
jgi:hypothetical protein